MSQVGSFALIVALALSGYSFLGGLYALIRKGPGSAQLSETARRAGIASFVAVFLGALVLVVSAFRNDFSIAYIYQHSNRDLPLPYKFATLWSGQEGSLLFWALLLSGYGLVLAASIQNGRTPVRACVSCDCRGAGFLSSAAEFRGAAVFAHARNIPADGAGLNPLLQYPEMVIHPPMLYLGYVGFTVPFAFALGALSMRYPGEKWIHITRRWTMVTWGFLTCGISLGAHWAYNVLGWGGYWGWDPVENASLMPWLTGTAFLHSVMMQEKRGMMKTWNMWLIFTTFMLTIFGTFLTRSGVVSSVHAFAQSPIGDWFVVFLAIVAGGLPVHLYLAESRSLEEREQAGVAGFARVELPVQQLVLLVACFTVLWGTLFPVLSEWVQGHKVTVGPPFFNNVRFRLRCCYSC